MLPGKSASFGRNLGACRPRRRNNWRGGIRGRGRALDLRSRRCYLRRRSFTGANNPGDDFAYGHDITGLRVYTRENAIRWRLDLEHRFVRFYFQEWLTLNHALAFRLPPSHKLAAFLRHFESGHNNAESHKS